MTEGLREKLKRKAFENCDKLIKEEKYPCTSCYGCENFAKDAVEVFKQHLKQRQKKWKDSEDSPRMPLWHQRREAVIAEYDELLSDLEAKEGKEK